MKTTNKQYRQLGIQFDKDVFKRLERAKKLYEKRKGISKKQWVDLFTELVERFCIEEDAWYK